MRGQRKLDQDPVDIFSCIQHRNELQELFGGRVRRGRNHLREDAELGAGLDLAANVDLGSRHIAHQNHGQTGRVSRIVCSSNLSCDFGLDLRGNRDPIQNDRRLRTHNTHEVRITRLLQGISGRVQLLMYDQSLTYDWRVGFADKTGGGR
jgi:hypothetical protein